MPTHSRRYRGMVRSASPIAPIAARPDAQTIGTAYRVRTQIIRAGHPAKKARATEPENWTTATKQSQPHGSSNVSSSLADLSLQPLDSSAHPSAQRPSQAGSAAVTASNRRDTQLNDDVAWSDDDDELLALVMDTQPAPDMGSPAARGHSDEAAASLRSDEQEVDTVLAIKASMALSCRPSCRPRHAGGKCGKTDLPKQLVLHELLGMAARSTAQLPSELDSIRLPAGCRGGCSSILWRASVGRGRAGRRCHLGHAGHR